jgi:hypothetical protein
MRSALALRESAVMRKAGLTRGGERFSEIHTNLVWRVSIRTECQRNAYLRRHI